MVRRRDPPAPPQPGPGQRAPAPAPNEFEDDAPQTEIGSAPILRQPRPVDDSFDPGLEAPPDTMVSLQPAPEPPQAESQTTGAVVSAEFVEERPTHLDLRTALGMPIEPVRPRAAAPEVPAAPVGAPALVGLPAPPLPAVPGGGESHRPPQPGSTGSGSRAFVLRTSAPGDDGRIELAREGIGIAALLVLLLVGTRWSRPSEVTGPAPLVATSTASGQTPRSWKDSYRPPAFLAPEPVVLAPEAGEPLVPVPAASLPRSEVSLGEERFATGQVGTASATPPKVRAAPSAPGPSPPPAEPPVAPAAQPMLSVISRPDGALVTVDGQVLGRTPLVRAAPAGGPSRRVELTLLGHRPWRGEVAADRAGHFSVTVELTPN